ncbi:MAG: hypothetical protein MJZ72_07205 [Bacteroidales bacterium]|nr:hypothetical protein [Bacteroidales bacterium]
MKKDIITIIVVVAIVAVLALVIIAIRKRQQQIEESQPTIMDSITSIFGSIADSISGIAGKKQTSITNAITPQTNTNYGLTDEQTDYWIDYIDNYDYEQWD